jgi:hypothetical protein
MHSALSWIIICFVMESLTVGFEKSPNESELDTFLALNAGGSVFQTSNWRTVIEKQGYSPMHFVARDNKGLIKAFFPFFLSPVRNTPFKIAHSLPRSELGGPILAEDVHPDELSGPLIGAMKRMALKKRVLSYTVVTPELDLCSKLLPTSAVESPASYLHLDLKQTPPEQIWNDIFTRDSRQRNSIRRMEKDGVTTRMAAESDVPEFYSLYHKTLTRAGVSPHPYSFLSDIWTSMGPKYFNILLSFYEGKVVGGSAFLCQPERRRIWLLLGAYETQTGTRNAIHLFTWWRALLWASENGYERVELGTDTPNPRNPVFRFKNQFAPLISKKYFVRQLMIPEPTIRVLSKTRRIVRKARFDRAVKRPEKQAEEKP